MHLRPRHLVMVEEYGFRLDYDREAIAEYFSANWYRLFGSAAEIEKLTKSQAMLFASQS